MSGVERVEVANVSRNYGGTAALRGINVSLDAGELVVLEGQNGSGKSTLLAIIGTLVRPTAGTVSYFPDFGSTAQVRGQIGWLSHEGRVYPELNARQNLAFGARCYGVDPRKAWASASRRFELEAFADRPYRHLSRGQRQRVALARATLHSPSLLLLDEPTTGLDREGVETLMSLAKEEAARGSIVLLVTHDPELARSLATRRLRLERGRLLV